MNVLYSYVHGPKSVGRLLSCWRHPVLVDSGAFSIKNAGATIDLEEYIRFCLRYAHTGAGFVQLDVVANKEQTARNLDTMLGAGVVPVPVLTTDEDVARTRELVQVNQWVCLAGGTSMSSERFLSRASRAHKEAVKGRPDPVLHGLGFTRAPQGIILSGLKTVDSVSWKIGAEKFGNSVVFEPIRGVQRQVQPGKDFATLPPVGVFGKRSTGHWYNYKVVLSCVAALRLSERLRRRGVRMFFVVGGKSDVGFVLASALSLGPGWTINWEVYTAVVAEVERMELEDLSAVSAQAMLNVYRQEFA